MTAILSLEEAAQCFAALGSEQRMAVLQALVAAGPDGLTAGALTDKTGIAGSTLTHHLRFLSQTGLIRQERRGRQILSFAAFERIEDLSRYLLLNCCSDTQSSHDHHEVTAP